MRFARTVFTVAGMYGIVILVPPLFLESQYNRMYPPPITHPEFFYGFFALGIAWQILFFILATDPIKYRAMMIPAMLEKIGYPLALLFMHLHNRIAPRMFAIGSLDWIFLILFAIAYARTAPRAVDLSHVPLASPGSGVRWTPPKS
jgi:hypothetical protein